MNPSNFLRGSHGLVLGTLLALSATAPSAAAQPEPAAPESAPEEDGWGPTAAPDAVDRADGAPDLLPDRPAPSAGEPGSEHAGGTAAAASEAAALPAKASKPGEKKLGPAEIEISEGNSVGVGFAGQLRTTITSRDNGTADSRETIGEVAVRRLRFSLNGSFFDKKLKTSAQLNFVPGQLELLDLYASYKFIDELQLQLGEFKIPFTRYRAQSFQRLLLTDWSPVTQHFGSERQMGVMLHNGQKDDTPFSYSFGVFTGTNSRASFERGLAQSYGESLPNPSDLADPALPEELHPELVLRLAHNAKDIDAETNSDWRGGPFRHAVGLSAAWDVQPVATRDFQARIAPELLLKWHGVSANAVGYLGLFQTTQEETELGSWGLNTEVAWRVSELVELAWRFAHVDQQDALRDDAKARAASLIAEADEADVSALRKQYSSAGKVANEQEIGMGLNLYVWGNSVKWQQDICYLRKERDTDARHDIRARLQAQIAF